mmetsp:Transcript_21870/g.61133  ORF Transcript_21870/g.61133 Transcript_21870/m.61133 type:complete len:320 (+) Transcript_21870:691-1650(+)
MQQQTEVEAVPNRATPDVLLAVVVVRRVVVLRDGVRDDELVEGVDETQDPEGHQHVEDELDVLLPRVRPVRRFAVRAVRDAAGGVELDEADDQHQGQDALEEGLGHRKQQQGWHLEHGVASDLHASGSHLDAVVEATAQTAREPREQQADERGHPGDGLLILSEGRRQGRSGAHAVLHLRRHSASIREEVDPEHTETHYARQDRAIDKRLRAMPEQHEVDVAEHHRHKEGAHDHRPGRNDGGERFHVVDVGAGELLLGQLLGHVAVDARVGQAEAIEDQLRLVGLHALRPSNDRALRHDVVRGGQRAHHGDALSLTRAR